MRICLVATEYIWRKNVDVGLFSAVIDLVLDKRRRGLSYR